MKRWLQAWKLNRVLDREGEAQLWRHAMRHPADRPQAQRLAQLSERLSDQAPAWLASTAARSADPATAGNGDRAMRLRRWALAGGGALAAAAAVVIAVIVVQPGGGPTETPTDRQVATQQSPLRNERPGVAPQLAPGAWVDRSATAVEAPLRDEARRVARDVRDAAESAMSPLLAMRLDGRERGAITP